MAEEKEKKVDKDSTEDNWAARKDKAYRKRIAKAAKK